MPRGGLLAVALAGNQGDNVQRGSVQKDLWIEDVTPVQK
jgi:uncharacterized circularly permuted ATP-grasp superfamily protein